MTNDLDVSMPTEALPRGSRVALFGGGGHAGSLRAVLARAGVRVELVVAPVSSLVALATVTDDAEGMRVVRENGWWAVPAVGDNRRRLRIAQDLQRMKVPTAVVIGDSATVHTTTLGHGTVVFEQAHVGPDTVAGVAVVVNSGALIEHGCRLEDGVHVGPGAVLAGDVHIGRGSLIGVGATVLPGVRIGAWATVGAGAVVTSHVLDGGVVAGNPARTIHG